MKNQKKKETGIKTSKIRYDLQERHFDHSGGHISAFAGTILFIYELETKFSITFQEES